MGGPGSGKSKRVITRERPRTRWFCRWKPLRSKPRVWGEVDAARICCAALAGGDTTMANITARVQKTCPEQVKDERKTAQESAIAVAAEAVLLENNVLLLDSYRMFLIINGILIGAAALLRAVPNPLVRAVSVGAAVARSQVAVILQRTIVQRAANDEMVRRIQEIERALGRAA